VTSEPGQGERLYRALLRLYPRRFRDEFEVQLLDLFRYRRNERLRCSRGLGLRFWCYIVSDLTTAAWQKRRDPIPAAGRGSKVWKVRLGSDPDVLGRTLRIGGGSVTIVGVGPEALNGGSGFAAIALWLAISAMAPTGGRVMSLSRRQDHPFTVRARLAPGVSMAKASAAMDRLAEELAGTYPELNADRDITVSSSLDIRISPEVDAQLFLAGGFAMAVVVLVLLIGTLNLANLLLVRSTARAREIAVRLALGAGRARVVRVVLGEAVLLLCALERAASPSRTARPRP
jgi:putative ABC transport system permease protein